MWNSTTHRHHRRSEVQVSCWKQLYFVLRPAAVSFRSLSVLKHALISTSETHKHIISLGLQSRRTQTLHELKEARRSGVGAGVVRSESQNESLTRVHRMVIKIRRHCIEQENSWPLFDLTCTCSLGMCYLWHVPRSRYIIPDIDLVIFIVHLLVVYTIKLIDRVRTPQTRCVVAVQIINIGGENRTNV